MYDNLADDINMKHFIKSYLLFVYTNGLGHCGIEERGRGPKVLQWKKITEIIWCSLDYNLWKKKLFPVCCFWGTFKTCRLLKIVIGIGSQDLDKTPAMNTQFSSRKKDTRGIFILFLNFLLSIKYLLLSENEATGLNQGDLSYILMIISSVILAVVLINNIYHETSWSRK